MPYYRQQLYRQQQLKQHDYYYSPPTSPPPPNCSVIATVRGWLAHEQGGRLESVETGVALLVPPGALPPSAEPHLVYFKVCRQDHGADDAKGTRASKTPHSAYLLATTFPVFFF